MAKLVDALVSGTSVRKDVQVRVLFWALNNPVKFNLAGFFICLILSVLSGKSKVRAKHAKKRKEKKLSGSLCLLRETLCNPFCNTENHREFTELH